MAERDNKVSERYNNACESDIQQVQRDIQAHEHDNQT